MDAYASYPVHQLVHRWLHLPVSLLQGTCRCCVPKYMQAYEDYTFTWVECMLGYASTRHTTRCSVASTYTCQGGLYVADWIEGRKLKPVQSHFVARSTRCKFVYELVLTFQVCTAMTPSCHTMNMVLAFVNVCTKHLCTIVSFAEPGQKQEQRLCWFAAQRTCQPCCGASMQAAFCESRKTVLATEQSVNNQCWRCSSSVVPAHHLVINIS